MGRQSKESKSEDLPFKKFLNVFGNKDYFNEKNNYTFIFLSMFCNGSGYINSSS